jgi:hypothetical protein
LLKLPQLNHNIYVSADDFTETPCETSHVNLH